MKIRNNEIFIIIKYFLNNLIFEMFSHNSHFNKLRKYKRKENDNKFNNWYNKFNKCYKHTHYNNDEIRSLKTINDYRWSIIR